MVEAFLVLYEATFDDRWFSAARETADSMIERFADPDTGASSRPRPTPRSSSPGGRTSMTTRSPRAALQPPSASCGWRRSPASTATPNTPIPSSVSSGASPSATRTLSPPPARDRLRPRPGQEVALVGDDWTSWPRSCARSSDPTSSWPAGRRDQRARAYGPSAPRSRGARPHMYARASSAEPP